MIVLIVEDEKMIRQGIRSMVQRSGAAVEDILECSNGEAALELLKVQKVDVMFTDIRMPKMDGIELVRAMQKLPCQPFTIAVSGYDDFSYAVELMRMGVREYLLKPIDRDKIREILKKLEEELTRKRENARYDRRLGEQRLKQVILNEPLASEEQELLDKMYEGTFLAGDYRVVCGNETGGAGDGEKETDKYIRLSRVGENEVFLLGCDALSDLLQEELTDRCVGISGIHAGIDALKEAYEEALFARKEAFYLEKRVRLYEEIVIRKASLHLEKKVLEQIVLQLGTDKYEEALKQLSRILKNASLGGYPPLEIEEGMKSLLDGILATYAKIIDVREEELQGYYAIYGYECLSEYETELLGWLRNFCETLNRRFDDYKNRQKIQQAIQYIRENYDKDLNMAVVSNHISMNYSLFSYVFKQYAGNNFVNYLREIRIAEAKRLLEETDMKVVEVSARVGYENEKHFMKTFKASCGISPTEYRRNKQFKGEEQQE